MTTPDTEVSVTQPAPTDLLICVFVHGFKGTDSTFAKFPDRLAHLLAHSIEGVKVECIVFPAYETKGELSHAVERFVDWLTTLTVEKEVAHGTGGGAGKAKIILCGHSMGGLIIADSLLAIASSRAHESNPLWPRIVACIAYDTPFLGLHPGVVKNKAAGFVDAARGVAAGVGLLGGLGMFGKKSPAPDARTAKPESPGESQRAVGEASKEPERTPSPWSKWAPAVYGVGGALLAGAAAGTAYYNRAEVQQGFSWATDHMKYVSTLWNEQALKGRVDNLLEVGKKEDVMFRVFYTYLPEKPLQPGSRTFIILPARTQESRRYFIAAKNELAEDEVAAHIGMFEAGSNDGYYQLGLKTAEIITEVVARVQAKEGKIGADATTKTS